MSQQPAAKPTDYAPTDVYQLITDRFITALEGGIIPWRKPWNEQYGTPRNYVTGRPYTGVNAFLLHYGCEVPFFLTFHQAQELGGYIRKGAHGHPVVYFQVKTALNKTTQQEERRFLLKKYTVFSVLDVAGVEIQLPTLAPATHSPIEAAEALVKGWAGGPPIVNKQERAYYSPALDYVNMPKAASFTSPELYYSVLFHELVHGTGHPRRLARPQGETFGSAGYAREELIAEMGAAFLCAVSGLRDAQTFENSAAYVQNWLRALRSDKMLVVQAAGRAAKAADLILGVARADEPAGGSPPAGAAPVGEPGPAAAAPPEVPAGPRAGDGAAPQGSPAQALDFTQRTYRQNVRRVLAHPAFSPAERAIHEAAARASQCAQELGQLKAVLLLIAERWEDAQLAREGGEPPAPADAPEPLTTPQLSGDHHEVIAYAVRAFGHLRPFEQAQTAADFADQIARAYAVGTARTRRVCRILRTHPTYALPFRARLG